MNTKYPLLEVNLKHLRHNVEVVAKRCEEKGIELTGVVKGATSLFEVAKAFELCGCKNLASSRIDQIISLKEHGIKCPLMMIRIPMISEVEDVISYADYSLNSELSTILALNEESRKQGKIHNVILMADIGDLREGYWDKDEMEDVAFFIENELDNIYLAGVGTNVGCYGSVLATHDKLNELVEVAERIEKRIGRKLDIISGGATSSLMRVWDNDIPKRINNLRVGEGILFARDLDVYYGYDMSALYQDVFKLKAEVLEIKDKPTHPVGELAVDAFCKKREYPNRGIRKRALIGVGKVDYSDICDIFPIDEGIEIVGCSSDHTILDIEDIKRDLKVGDILDFNIDYGSLIFLSNCKTVHISFID